MHAVGGVAVGVAQVEIERPVEVVEREFVVADLGRDDRLHTRRQRRVAGGDRVVVVEVAPLLLRREVLAAQERGQHDVGLLEHLVAVDDERVVVEQQRIRVDVGVPSQSHGSSSRNDASCGWMPSSSSNGMNIASAAASQSSSSPRSRSVLRTRRASNASRVPLRQEPDRAGGVAQVEARHHVRVRVVVDDRRVLVGARDPMDVERLSTRCEP